MNHQAQASAASAPSFTEQIVAFNRMYRLPVAERPSVLDLGEPLVHRLMKFKSILGEELKELDPIIEQATTMQPYIRDIDLLVQIADLLGDVMVYCASEMAKYGLPQEEILATIMASNFSKLGEDGQPIYDERGKVQKGPSYWKPEPKLKELLLACGAKSW